MNRLSCVLRCDGLGLLLAVALLGFSSAAGLGAETADAPLTGLPAELAAQKPEDLARDARTEGDPVRGAILFHQAYMACTKCHSTGRDANSLGPNLAQPVEKVTDAYLVESILEPSKSIRKGYETVTVVTDDGQLIVGLLAEDGKEKLVLRDPSQNGKPIEIPKDSIDERRDGGNSIMPAGLANSLTSRQQFLDLASYLIAINEGGAAKALELKPDPALFADAPLPEYEAHLDHAGMISELNQQSYRRGEAIYNRLCINCHGTHDKPGSLPTSLKFASGKFKNGNDPHSMYQTVTRGFGLMPPQTWMVPEQKYDVIHYVREAYLKQHNPSQFAPIDAQYLARLPEGDTRGPKPSNILPWEQMNYGPSMILTVEIPGGETNFAYKGIATRLDAGPGGISQGHHWSVFDHDTLRVAVDYSGQGFIDWNCIHFNGRHAIHPKTIGQVTLANPPGPGWANPETGSFDDPRLVGRDGRKYGPLPRRWAHYKGLYQHGQRTVVSYTVGDTPVLETSGLAPTTSVPVFTRTLNIGPRDREMVLQVARQGDGSPNLAVRKSGKADELVALFGGASTTPPSPPKQQTTKAPGGPVRFDGQTYLEPAMPDALEMFSGGYTVYARVKTNKGGTLLSKSAAGNEWVRDGKTLFVRGGRLTFDIGWVGAVIGRKQIADGKWHDVAMTWNADSGAVRLYVDGKLDASGSLKPKENPDNEVARIGYTAADFPRGQSGFDGELAELRFYRRALGEEEVAALPKADVADAKKSLAARWDLAKLDTAAVADATGGKNAARVVRASAAAQQPSAPKTSAGGGSLVAGVIGDVEGLRWESEGPNLRLRIPAGKDPLRFTLWTARAESTKAADELVGSVVVRRPQEDLSKLTSGGPSRWPEVLTAPATIGDDDGAFAVDELTLPQNDPWFSRLRLTGFDFFDDADRMAVCTWDGNVFLVSGLSKLPKTAADASASTPLTWRRIASGLFQPLGLKIVEGQIYVSCRDQICILHDRNGDGETDFYESFNNDHQVTDHFHEFAMGLQTDKEGNFYYAKSARHALTALVPHHGTLLRVSKDGSQTDIVANGFRAANGVCLNPDGTFIVTDQEGHWNPKNRINWVKPGGFYGNMFGYHDVTDSSDEAMEPPLCWITNSFDRSPAELLWVDSKTWGPLYGTLLNLSYGYGQIFVVPHEEVQGLHQGGMSPLPLPRAPTGIMRGRFHPDDGQLYTCGMFAWAGNQTAPGGFYRIRYTGKPPRLPLGLHAKEDAVEIVFSDPVDAATAADVSRYAIKVWDLKRTKGYGSKHFNERPLKIAGANVLADGKTLRLEIPGLAPTWGMEIKYSLKSADGKPFDGVIHNTIHHLGK